jgi:hypothetical protein
LKDTVDRIEFKARQISEIEEDLLLCDCYIMWYFLPAMPGREYWFHCPSTQVSFTLKLPPNSVGFAYYLVLSQGHMEYDVGFGCECYWDNSSGERICITSFTRGIFYYNSWDNMHTSIHKHASR